MEEKDRVTSDLTLVLKQGGPRTLRMISEPVINHSGVRTAYRMALIDVTEEKRFEDELQLLSNLAEVSNSPLQHSEPLEVAARVLVPAFADLLKIDLLNEEGKTERVLVTFAEPGKQKTLAEPMKNYAPRPGWKTAQAKVIESGEPMLLEEIPDIARDRMAHDETHAEHPQGCRHPVDDSRASNHLGANIRLAHLRDCRIGPSLFSGTLPARSNSCQPGCDGDRKRAVVF